MKYTYKQIKDSLTKKKNSRSSLWIQLWVRKFSFPITYMFSSFFAYDLLDSHTNLNDLDFFTSSSFCEYTFFGLQHPFQKYRLFNIRTHTSKFHPISQFPTHSSRKSSAFQAARQPTLPPSPLPIRAESVQIHRLHLTGSSFSG